MNYKNKFGHQGVDFMEKLQKFRARITLNYKEYHIGVFSTLEEAVYARNAKEKELWGIQPRRALSIQ